VDDQRAWLRSLRHVEDRGTVRRDEARRSPPRLVEQRRCGADRLAELQAIAEVAGVRRRPVRGNRGWLMGLAKLLVAGEASGPEVDRPACLDSHLASVALGDDPEDPVALHDELDDGS